MAGESACVNGAAKRCLPPPTARCPRELTARSNSRRASNSEARALGAAD